MILLMIAIPMMIAEKSLCLASDIIILLLLFLFCFLWEDDRADGSVRENGDLGVHKHRSHFHPSERRQQKEQKELKI